MEGNHQHAVKDLESTLPLIQHAPAHIHFDILNSYAVELGEAGRIQEAKNVSRITIASPFAPYYSEWQSTFSEIRSKRRSCSNVSISLPQHHAEPANNILPFPAQRKSPEVETIMSLRETGIDLTPLQLLGLILKLVLKSRITDDEVDKICTTYYDAINELWAD